VLGSRTCATRGSRPHPRHGTGCTLSAAITASLALGRPLETAVTDALDYVHRAIAAAPMLGQGHGPVGDPGDQELRNP
jgi:hydroxymethylpyrimidine/phosphomethylpyrimidine kinase